MKNGFELSAAIKGKYQVKTHLPILYTSIGCFDFRTITVEEAEKVAAIAPEYLVKVKPAK